MGFPIEGWLVLPDRPDARRVVAGWPPSRWVLAHASGSPWLVGSLDQGEVILAAVGSLRVAVIGSCPVTATRLSDLVTRVRAVAELDPVARVLPGCCHLVASVEGVVRVQGSLTGLRRVFHTRIGGLPVAGERADVLARVAGAGIDEQALAVRVACGPQVPPRWVSTACGEGCGRWPQTTISGSIPAARSVTCGGGNHPSRRCPWSSARARCVTPWKRRWRRADLPRGD